MVHHRAPGRGQEEERQQLGGGAGNLAGGARGAAGECLFNINFNRRCSDVLSWKTLHLVSLMGTLPPQGCHLVLGNCATCYFRRFHA